MGGRQQTVRGELRTTRRVRRLTAWSGWGLSAGLEGMTVPPWIGTVLIGGARVDASYWGDSIGVRVGTGLFAGEAGGEPVRIAHAALALGLAGPRVGVLRLDVELGLQGGLTWVRNPELDAIEQKAFWGLSADLVLRLPLSARWGLAGNLGYRRLNAGDAADVLALGVAVTRAL